jgi:hypothetical protein
MLSPHISGRHVRKLSPYNGVYGAGKIKLTPEDAQAVREVTDKTKAAQGDHYPKDY